jgi:hypothetical protein
MQYLKSVGISYILPVVAAWVVVSCASKDHQSNQLCKHQFALCTSAPCVPQPGDPTKAICFCDVKEGPSLATVSCDTIAPSVDANGISTVYSTFSLDQFNEGKKGLQCPSDTPWTWCLNKRCTVDPSNPKKAICTCDVMRNVGQWMTLGGNCDTTTCKTGYWSGAAMTDFNSGVVFLMKVLDIENSPVKWCPAS